MTAPKTERNARIMKLTKATKPVPLTNEDIAVRINEEGYDKVTRQAVGLIIKRAKKAKAKKRAKK